ncbi:GNAT family N-acetyltransferase [Frondihabitans australicus]|uniref:Acetyltransferase (GNAT) family protein n=1 Tax=Frondihabitans australicus TaxID=386892 RepID=A0A495IGH4_9MICO|nr:GNAT family N-acetyltransferase [Frondihabitans australicus]RKR75097.1 acetyltransferase (GNAT) family protein [Frondihabitans australicus]
MTVSLKPMDPATFEQWKVVNRAEYVESRMKAGESREAAQDNANRSFERYFPNGVPGPDQVVFDVVDTPDDAADGPSEGEVVGVLWIGVSDAANRAWYVYDIEMHESQRGRGLGRQTMLLAEAEARARGAQSLGLNVFGFNTVARHLYESLGYEPTAIQMKKPL